MMESNGDGNSKTNLIVNYLPQTLTDDEFRSMFLSIGPLQSCKIVRDRATNYSYGFGFVDYQNQADAERAIETLNGLPLQNKKLKVALARTGDGVKGANLYIRNLPHDITESELKEYFSEYGYIINCRVLADTSGKNKGVGFVLFENKDMADRAISQLDNQSLPGHSEKLSVKYADDNRGKARPNFPGAAFGGYHPMAMAPAGPMGDAGYGGGFGYGGAPAGFGPGPIRGPAGRGQNRYNPMQQTPYGAGMTGGMQNSAIGTGYTLFVYNILPESDERFLWQLFAPFGAVNSVNIIKDMSTDVGKGFGFVSMRNYEDCVVAIQSLSGFTGHGGKPLQVSFKTSKQ